MTLQELGTGVDNGTHQMCKEMIYQAVQPSLSPERTFTWSWTEADKKIAWQMSNI